MHRLLACLCLIGLLALSVSAQACTFEQTQEKASQLALYLRDLAKTHPVRYHEIMAELGQLSITEPTSGQREALCRHYDRLVWAARHPFGGATVSRLP